MFTKKLILDSPITIGNKTGDRVELLRCKWRNQEASFLGTSVEKEWQVDYIVCEQSETGYTASIQLFHKRWLESDPDDAQNQSEDWLLENNGLYSGTVSLI